MSSRQRWLFVVSVSTVVALGGCASVMWSDIASRHIANYELAKSSGVKMDQCVSARAAAGAYLNAQDSENYQRWTKISQNDCQSIQGGMPNVKLGFFAKKWDPIVVDSIEPGSSAALAGMKVGDVVREIDGVRVAKPNDLIAIMQKRNPGDKTSVRVERDGATLDLPMTFQSR